MEGTAMTIKEFTKVLGITMEVEYMGEYPIDGFSPPFVDKWECDIKCEGAYFQCQFHTGIGLRNGDELVEPTIEDVFECLALEASGTTSISSFEEWAEEFGYNPDSIRDKRVYDVCVEQTNKLKNFLGVFAFRILRACVEGI